MEAQIFQKFCMISEVIEGHIRSTFYLKPHFQLDIICLQLNIIKTFYER